MGLVNDYDFDGIDSLTVPSDWLMSSDNTTISSSDNKEEWIQEVLRRLSHTPIIKHQCHSCGATLEIDENKHIFVCKYCGSVYAFDTSMING